ncbi:MAG: OprO/OprP family phosphate-selective porin [Gemmatimonadetes bacterium]|nr:OprO/OprP family phosphate-selective porin [Gemmatimonadota bacterium]
MRRGGALAAVLVGVLLAAPPLAAQGAVQWQGYVQLRYGRTDPTSGFSVRRAKLWMKGSVPGVAHLAFKIQGIFRNGSSRAFVLQDVFAEYRRSAIALRFGQLVPDFSLQRSQPDYRVPLLERASVVETLIPGARTLGREIGAQVLLAPQSGWLHAAAGIFNGSGANRVPGSEGDYLATGRLVLAHGLGSGVGVSVGGSAVWRETHGTDVGVLSIGSSPFSGRDQRWGTEARLWGGRWNVQGEYLRANLAGEVSEGFYVLGTVAVGSSDQVTLSEERLDAAGGAPSGEPWFVFGFTRYLQTAPQGSKAFMPWDEKYPTKVTTDIRVCPGGGQAKVGAAVQVQMFLR